MEFARSRKDFSKKRRIITLSQHEGWFRGVKVTSSVGNPSGEIEVGSHRGDTIKTVRAVERALDILECFSFDRRELTLTEIAQSTGLPLPTAYRLVKILQRRGWVRNIGADNRYAPGLKLLQGGAVVLSGFTLREKAQPVLDALASETSGTVLLGAIEQGELVYVDRRDSRAPLRVVSEVGQVRPVTYGILGKLLLAHMPEDHVRRVLAETPLVKRARRSIVSEKEFLDELTRIRQDGYATAVDETMDGVSGVAAPIFGMEGKVIAGLAVLVPTVMWTDEVSKRDLNAVRRAAMQISESMGYHTAR